jgi:hypothetical protein
MYADILHEVYALFLNYSVVMFSKSGPFPRSSRRCKDELLKGKRSDYLISDGSCLVGLFAKITCCGASISLYYMSK